MAKKIRTRAQRKELSNKIAEIIWISLSGIVLGCGILLSLSGALIETISGNFKSSPLYFLIQGQDGFIKWVKSWWSSYPFSTFLTTGVVLSIVGLIFLLIILLVYSNKQEAIDRKEKARKLRENNVKRFEAQLEATSSNDTK